MEKKEINNKISAKKLCRKQRNQKFGKHCRTLQQFFHWDWSQPKEIDLSSVTFENYLKILQPNEPEHNFSINELKDAFFSLKLNKSSGYNDINFNVIKKCFESLHKPLLHIFNQSLPNGFFPDEMKITKVTYDLI